MIRVQTCRGCANEWFVGLFYDINIMGVERQALNSIDLQMGDDMGCARVAQNTPSALCQFETYPRGLAHAGSLQNVTFLNIICSIRVRFCA
jgi:hypothetical protein